MAEEKKEYSNEMRGTLFVLTEEEKKTNGPVATGSAQIAGVKIRIAMWPKRVVPNNGGKAAGKTYVPLSFEYPQGATKFLCGVEPANLTLAGTATQQAGAAPEPAAPSDDMPF